MDFKSLENHSDGASAECSYKQILLTIVLSSYASLAFASKTCRSLLSAYSFVFLQQPMVSQSFATALVAACQACSLVEVLDSFHSKAACTASDLGKQLTMTYMGTAQQDVHALQNVSKTAIKAGARC